MMIISIEGPSAVGKTSTAAEIALKYGGFHIPETYSWWRPPTPEYQEWWFERQADRWRIGQEKKQSHSMVVIDIDLFQPLWYNWSFDFTLFNNQSLAFIENIYRRMILDKQIGFPDKYYLLGSTEMELRARKERDETRGRRGFEMNLKFIEPQKHYFKAINEFIPDLVCFIESETIDRNVSKITQTIPANNSEHTYSIELFDFMIKWLKENKASTFCK